MLYTTGDRFGLCMVYRQANAPIARDIIESTRHLPGPCEIRLWALDRVWPDLRPVTVGCGPGGKFDLLNNLLADRCWDYTLLSDDDISIADGGLAKLVAAARRHRLDLVQPAHSPDSHYASKFVRRLPGVAARLTTFVEAGPLFMVGPTRRWEFMPFPSGIGMGWGLELSWRDRIAGGARLAIVDDCQITHLHPNCEEYDTGPEEDRLAAELGARGLDTIFDTHRVLELLD